PGADRPARLVGDHEIVMRLECDQLAAENVLGLASLAFGFALADTGDHPQPRLQRGRCAARPPLRPPPPPIQATPPSPASSAAAARRPTVSSVSPKYCRRSEWPTIAP